MILLLGVLAGFVAGWLRAKIHQRLYQFPTIHGGWLVWLALLPQILTFYLPATGQFVPDVIARAILVMSQALLLVFAWRNRHSVAFWVMGVGLGMNLVAIVANGGLMPISPETLHRLVPQQPIEFWPIGERLAGTKDIILAQDAIRLPWFVDRFTTPAWYPQATAFSLGDILLAVGVFLLLWQAGGVSQFAPTHPDSTERSGTP